MIVYDRGSGLYETVTDLPEPPIIPSYQHEKDLEIKNIAFDLETMTYKETK
jgi:hypothetical protein